MRRAIATLVGTIAVLVSLLSFKTEPRLPRARPAALAPITSSPGPRPLQSSAPATAASRAASSAASSVAPGPSAKSQSHPAAAKARTQAVAQAAPTAYTGQVISTDYGPVQVRITMSGSVLRDVEALQLPGDRRRSAAISSEAGPVLRQEALTAQSARIDTVSGATYTSDGYGQSLQSALDQAHAR